MSDETLTEASATNLPKAYDPSIIERRWAEYWVRERLFEVPTPIPNSGAPNPGEMGDERSNRVSFRPTGGPREAGEGRANAFTMLLPPPNVTGNLHMGHMFEHAESDILMRWQRMRGERALWVPGTDHAGIATQMLVERKLAAEGTDRKTLGREAFTERVWDWKRQYGNSITNQMRRLGASVDWSREYFTMDDRLSVAVREAFVRLYEQGLIYRGAYIVNWDPQIQTAVSDLEVVHEDRLGKLYHIRYPFADGTGSIVIATTRPETLLGDTAVAVNPNDERYQEFIGKLVTLPLSAALGHGDREIPILADDWAQPEFGTGAVKVTPAHDPNDFAIGQRHSLPSPLILDETGHVHLPGSPYHGLDRFAARERIVSDLEAAGLLVAIKDHQHAIALSQRTGAVIEPRLSLQWFLAVNKPPTKPPTKPGAHAGAPHLAPEMWDPDSTDPRRRSIADNATRAVEEGHIRFTPDQYRKTYMEWMSKIYDWCISRQLWWGHRIPAWHCAACQAITVARDTPTACATCGDTHITQETDVLDTWFSSGMLPFTVFGWPGTESSPTNHGERTTNNVLPPDENSRRDDEAPSSPTNNGERTTNNVLPPDLAAFYPTTLLVTGFDILFFWVARMIMLGAHFTLDIPMPDGSPRTLAEAVPFKAVYIHALVRDANREKMSKTKGNVIDPIAIIERFGTDAVRFTLASMASPGTDIAFSEARTEGYRAFANKIWNAARFLFMNLDRACEAGIPFSLSTREHVIPTGGEAGVEGPPHSITVTEPGAPSTGGEAGVERPPHSNTVTEPGAPSTVPLAMGGISSGAPPPSSPDPIALAHSITGKLASLIAASTPHGEATLATHEAVIPTGGEAGVKGTPHSNTVAGTPSVAPFAGGISSDARSPSSPDPIALSHSITGKLASLIAASTPHGEATLATGNIEATNPVVFPDAAHHSSAATAPLESRWILARLSETSAAVNASLADYRFDEAASHVYQFFWGDLCDWYLEIVKLRLNFETAPPSQNDLSFRPTADESASQTTAALTTLVAVFESALRLLSPFMPFLTEEIWHALYAGHPPAKSIALTHYPHPEDFPSDQAAIADMQTLQDLITTVRALRKELSVPEKEATPIRLHAAVPTARLAQSNADILAKLCRVSAVQIAAEPLAGNNARSTANFDVAVLYERQIDIPAERERLTKELAKHEKNLTASEARLGNEAFMAKAPAHIVEGLRKQAAETRTLYDKTRAALDALG